MLTLHTTQHIHYSYTALHKGSILYPSYRKKVVDISELESEFGSDLDFLMAKLSCCVEDKTVISTIHSNRTHSSILCLLEQHVCPEYACNT